MARLDGSAAGRNQSVPRAHGPHGAVQGGSKCGTGKFIDHAKYTARRVKPALSALRGMWGERKVVLRGHDYGNTLVVAIRRVTA